MIDPNKSSTRIPAVQKTWEEVWGDVCVVLVYLLMALVGGVAFFMMMFGLLGE